MAHDAMQPEAATVPPDDADEVEPEPEFSPEPPPRGRHAKGQSEVSSFLSMIHADLALMLFMFGLGMWICLIMLSVVFPFGGSINNMNMAGAFITTLTGVTALLLAPSIFGFLAEGERIGALLSIALLVSLIANWFGWKYHFNLGREIWQLFS